jgi:predicted component of type VI protein secretion system
VYVVVVFVDLLDEHTDNTKKYTKTLSDAHNKIGLKSGTVKTTQEKLQASAALRMKPSLFCDFTRRGFVAYYRRFESVYLSNFQSLNIL